MADIVAVGGQGGGGGGGVLALVVVLPVVHLLSIACLDALSRLPFLEVCVCSKLKESGDFQQ